MRSFLYRLVIIQNVLEVFALAMKQLNGTVTLCYLEEDNQQRVIFRVVPLCTREGVVFRSQKTEFPDHGSLRIVPDKREQSTFKERMRAMGNLCAIQLISDGKELAKVRQNRNYDPGQGECNQFAIYSDVISEFSDEGVFEVFDEGADYSSALSPRVLLRRGKVLYGPLDRTAPADWSVLRPYGNDSYLLHCVEMPDASQHTYYWDPEQTVNWRQRRGTLRRGKPGGENIRTDDGEQTPTTEAERPSVSISAQEPLHQSASVTHISMPVRAIQAQPDAPVILPQLPTRENAADTPVDPPAIAISEEPGFTDAAGIMEAETSLPIGTRLDILDNDISFEDQLSKLDQPISPEANLLAHAADTTPAADDEADDTPRYSGTPLVKTGVRIPAPVFSGATVQDVVERQMRAASRQPGAYQSDFVYRENPIEALNQALDAVWSDPDTRRQALDALCDNETFTQAFVKRLRLSGRELRAVEAAQDQLAEIEAERLKLLMQLDALKKDEKEAKDALRASMSQKKRDELAQLEERERVLRAEMEKLTALLTALGDQASRYTLETLAQQGGQLCVASGDTLTLAPRIGTKRQPEELIAAVRTAMNRQGFTPTEDDAVELLTYFAVQDEFCIRAETVSLAALCARAMLEALGLISVTAFTAGNTRLLVASLLPENHLRTPTVEVGPIGRPAAVIFGHKTIRVLDAQTVPPLGMPVLQAPPYRAITGLPRESESAAPVSLEALRAFREQAAPLPPAGEAWVDEMSKLLEKQGIQPAENTLRQVRVFLSVASLRLRGGFLAAADAATLGWAVPIVLERQLDLEALRPVLINLPRSLTALNIC